MQRQTSPATSAKPGPLTQRRTWSLALGGLFTATLLAFAAPQATYTNPIHPKDFPDPFVIVADGHYYAYATESGESRFQLMESRDLVHWTPKKLEFRVPWSREHLWAPEVVRHKARFYLTYSALDPDTKKHNIAVATADAPTGPFTHRAILVRGDDNRVGVIDATVFFDDETPYLIYSEEEPRRIVLRRLRSDLLGVEGEPAELIRPSLDWERGVTEAPSVVKRRGLYHLFYSAGPFQSKKGEEHYAMGHAVASSLRGSYKKSLEPLLKTVDGKVYGPGHQCLIADARGQMWVLYHAWDNQGEPHYGFNRSGRTLRLDPLVWDDDAPRILGPTLTPQPVPIVGEATPVP